MPDEQLAGQDTPAVTGEVQPPAAAPEQQAAPTDATTQGAEGQKEEPAAQKTFTQAELDEILQKRLAKAEARAERRVLRTLEKLTPQVQQPSYQQPVDDGKPSRANFANEEAFIEALTDWKLDQRERGQRQQAQQQQIKSLQDKTEQHYAQAEKLPGFDRDAFDELPLTPVIAQAIADSDVAPKLMAHLSAHPEEVERIAALSPARQAAEIGKLETKVSAAPTVKAPKAPSPIAPVGGGAAPVTDLNRLSAEDYYAARMKQKPVWARR